MSLLQIWMYGRKGNSFNHIFRYLENKLSKIIADKSNELIEDDSKTKIKNYTYIPYTPVSNFKGVIRDYQNIQSKYPNNIKLKITPQDLNFQATELWVPVFKTFTIRNNHKQSNIEIANITSENAQVEVSLEETYPVIIRPERSITVKVIVTAILKGIHFTHISTEF